MSTTNRPDLFAPVTIAAVFAPAGRGAAWRDPQRAEVTHDSARAGVWANVEGRRRLFCLVKGEEISEPTPAARRWTLRADALALLQRLAAAGW